MTELSGEMEKTRYQALMEHLQTPLFRNGYALIISTGITSLLGLLYWTIAARLYTTDSVGLNSTAISALFFLSGIAQINLQETMIRFIPQAGRRTLKLVLSTYAIVIVLSVIVGLIFCLSISLWAPALSFMIATPGAIAGFIFTLVAQGIFVLQDSILTGLRQALWIPLENAVFSIVKIVLLAVFALTLPATGVFSSWGLAVAAIILPMNYLIFKHLIPNYSARAVPETEHLPLGQISRYVAGNYVAALLANTATALMPILIVQLAGATANAHFYMAWVIASSLQIIIANMATSMTVEGARNQEKLDEFRQRAITGIARIVIPLAVLIIVGAPLILNAMAPGYSDDATLLLQLLAFAAVPNIFNMVYVALARVQNRTGGVMFVYGANAVMVMGLSLLLLPSAGITGVGIAWVISQTTIAIVLGVFGARPVSARVMVTTLEKEF